MAVPPFTCPACGAEFATEAELEEHAEEMQNDPEHSLAGNDEDEE